MSIKKKVCLMLLLVCCLPSLAFAKSYKCMDIYENKISTSDIVFSAGDKITGGRGISIEIYYVDGNENQVGKGNSSIKSINIDGKKCSEWKLNGISAAVMQIGNLVRGSFGFTMKPTYAVADSEGYFSISSDTYSSYINDVDKPKGKKVKFSGNIIDSKDGVSFALIYENAVIAFNAEKSLDYSVAVGDNVQCKGETSDYIQYNGITVPMITCSEIEKQEYKPLQKNDKGATVLQMKERLKELGYYKANSDLSDDYDDSCISRVKKFQKKNGIPVTGLADEETQLLLYSDSAK